MCKPDSIEMRKEMEIFFKYLASLDMVVALQRDLDLWRERKKKNVGAKLRWERRRDEKEKEANEKGAGN